MAENSDYILELLKENGLVTSEQVEQGWKKVAESDGAVDIVDALKNIGAGDPNSRSSRCSRNSTDWRSWIWRGS